MPLSPRFKDRRSPRGLHGIRELLASPKNLVTRTGVVTTLSVVALTGSLLIAPTTASAEAPAKHQREVVFILPGQSVGPLPYGKLRSSIQSAGFDARVLDLKGRNIRGDAAVLKKEVDKVRAKNQNVKVSLVGHSAGGISAREYLKHLGGKDHVSTYTAMGSPQYGSPSACFQQGSAKDLCPGSAFLKRLNTGDDTPGDTAYNSVQSTREWTDGRLDGGQCRMKPIEPPVAWLNGGYHHSIEPLQYEVIASTIAALNGVCTGKFVNEPDGAITPLKTFFRNGI